jgi:hypothetical protein
VKILAKKLALVPRDVAVPDAWQAESINVIKNIASNRIRTSVCF